MPRMGGGLTTKHMPSGAKAVAPMSSPARGSPPRSRLDQSLSGRKIVPALVFSPPPMRSKPLIAKAWKTAGFSAGTCSKAGEIFVM